MRLLRRDPLSHPWLDDLYGSLAAIGSLSLKSHLSEKSDLWTQNNLKTRLKKKNQKIQKAWLEEKLRENPSAARPIVAPSPLETLKSLKDQQIDRRLALKFGLRKVGKALAGLHDRKLVTLIRRENRTGKRLSLLGETTDVHPTNPI